MNYSWARKTAQTGLVAAGAVLVAGAGTAHASGPDVTTQGQVGAVSGNQVVAPVQVPVNVCGVAAAVLGTADAGCEGGADADYSGSGNLTTQNNTGLLNGNQAYAPVQAPVDVSGLAAAVGGHSGAGSEGGSNATVEESAVAESGHTSESDTTTQRNIGALSGNQLLAPVQAPVNACGNAISVLGISSAGCEGGASADYSGSGSGDLLSQDNTGLGNGNQVFAPVQAPVNVCGNAIAILGTATASCEGGADADIPADDEEDHDGDHKHDSHKGLDQGDMESAETESASTEAAATEATEESLAGLDTVTDVVSDAPVVGGLVGSTTSEGVADTATDTVTELAGAGLL